jgi:hypothetical protein
MRNKEASLSDTPEIKAGLRGKPALFRAKCDEC